MHLYLLSIAFLLTHKLFMYKREVTSASHTSNGSIAATLIEDAAARAFWDSEVGRTQASISWQLLSPMLARLALAQPDHLIFLKVRNNTI